MTSSGFLSYRVRVNRYELEVVEADEDSRKWMARRAQGEEKDAVLSGRDGDGCA